MRTIWSPCFRTIYKKNKKKKQTQSVHDIGIFWSIKTTPPQMVRKGCESNGTKLHVETGQGEGGRFSRCCIPVYPMTTCAQHPSLGKIATLPEHFFNAGGLCYTPWPSIMQPLEWSLKYCPEVSLGHTTVVSLELVMYSSRSFRGEDCPLSHILKFTVYDCQYTNLVFVFRSYLATCYNGHHL